MSPCRTIVTMSSSFWKGNVSYMKGTGSRLGKHHQLTSIGTVPLIFLHSHRDIVTWSQCCPLIGTFLGLGSSPNGNMSSHMVVSNVCTLSVIKNDVPSSSSSRTKLQNISARFKRYIPYSGILQRDLKDCGR